MTHTIKDLVKFYVKGLQLNKIYLTTYYSVSGLITGIKALFPGIYIICLNGRLPVAHQAFLTEPFDSLSSCLFELTLNL